MTENHYAKWNVRNNGQRPSYDADPLWQKKPFTPAQLLVNDVRVDESNERHGPMLDINEVSPSALIPGHAVHLPPNNNSKRVSEATGNPIEQQKFLELEGDYGWLRRLRLSPQQDTKCRWIHYSSRFPEYLRGFLWALSDDVTTVADSMKMLDHVVQRNTQFSRHGKYFQPFSETLRAPSKGASRSPYPMLISVPFLDWDTQGARPALRFQIDKREGFRSSRSSGHLLRSILQYHYRLEDTRDRESTQVFAKHKPWSTNAELDLKIRRWYGNHPPTSLIVDELWLLLVDERHIVTFSSNQTWKAVWPPLQLASRIFDVAFRGIRNHFFATDDDRDYDTMTHAIACLSGAVGMMHRSFWTDFLLTVSERYADHLGHIQYRLIRSPNTNLVMDLIACLEELNIVIRITEDQLAVIRRLQPTFKPADIPDAADVKSSPVKRYERAIGDAYDTCDVEARPSFSRRATFRQFSTSNLSDPYEQLIDNLERELVDIRELRDNTDRQITRTIQLVNIRLEDHGKAILVFTVVTIIFLPLNFVSSFFGMNFSDIRDMARTQWLFWAVALCVTIGVVGISILLAFSGSSMLEKIHSWGDARRERRANRPPEFKRTLLGKGFQVHGVDKET